MANVNPVLAGTAQAVFHATEAPSSSAAAFSQNGTFTATAGSFMLWTVQYWSPTATAGDNITTVQMTIGGVNPTLIGVNVAQDPAGPFSVIATFLVPNTFVGSGIAWNVTFLANANFPASQPARNLTVSCIGVANIQGVQGFFTGQGDGVSTSLAVSGSITNGAGLMLMTCGGSTTFTSAATTGALISNMTFNAALTASTTPPWAAATSTGSGGSTVTGGGSLTTTIPMTAASLSAQAMVIVFSAEFQPADARVPAVYDVQIDNQVYLVDYSQPFYRQFSEQLDTITRTQADGGATTGENSMDPKGLWRRSQEDWRMGAGQTWLDRKQSNNQNSLPNGFNYSKGMELGVGWQGSLLNQTTALISPGAGFTTPKMITLQTVHGSATTVPGVIVSQATNTSLQATGFTAAGTITTTTLVTAPGSNNIADFCTDGFNVYFVTSAGVYLYQPVFTGVNGSGGTTTLIASGSLDVRARIAYFNGRLILAFLSKIWNITSLTAAALGTTNTGVNPLVYTAGAPNIEFTSIAGGLSGIYVISNTVDNTNSAYNDGGQVWLITMGSDGLQLNPPQIAGAVTTGESIYSALYYLNNLILYTSLGVRCCQVNSDGSVTLGTLITLPGPIIGKQVRNAASPTGGNPPTEYHFDMCASGEYVYFPLSNWDLDPTQVTTANPRGITCTGTGRLDLGNFVISNLEPAWQTYVYAGYAGNNTFAPNLVTAGGSNVSGVAMACTLIPYQWSTTNNFNVQPGGVAFCYVSDGQATTPAGTSFFAAESQAPVAAGFLSTGKIGYDLVDNKVLGALDIQGRNFQGIYSAISVDDEAVGVIETTQGNAGTANLTFPLNNTGSHFELTIGLTSITASTNTPTIIRWTLRAYPAPTRPIQWTIPIILNEDLGNLTGQANGYDVRAQLETLYSLVNTGKQVTFRRGVETFVCFLSDISFLPDTPSENGNTLRSFFNGMCYVTINSLPAWQSTISAG